MPKGKEHAKKNSKGKNKAKEPETFEELMEEGVKQEEKGECYQTGEKAERFYERARELYAKAYEKKPNDADCLYNWGRILYILVNFVPSHSPPELKLSLLAQSIEKFRAALVMDPDNADALFNLAQALTSQADVIRERDTDGLDDAITSYNEAVQSFERVYVLQQKELMNSKPPQNNESGNDKVLNTESLKTTSSGGSGPGVGSSTSLISAFENLNLKKKGNQASSDGEQVIAEVTEITPVTTESLVDTLISIAHTLSCLAALVESLEYAEKCYIQAIQKLELALELDVPSKESEIQHQWANIYSSQAERAFAETGSMEQVERLYEIAAQKMNSVIEQDAANVEAICDRGDLLTEYANTLMKSVVMSKLDHEPERQEKIRELFDLAIKSFTLALELEPKNSAILEKLASLNFTMSLLPLAAMEKNKPELHNNALKYYKRALDADRDNLDTYLCYALVLCHVPGKDGDDVVQTLTEFIERGGNKEFVEEWQMENQELLRSSTIGKEYTSRVIETCFSSNSKKRHG
ncbi:2806_t:CDS:2 [Ambispora gerdemannii]|uniref:2806_t:CDS:1 n=1 Tax=Ambispora gerdemannii TaxID=144530 RepID=A0A9N9BX84_9GLOM|nr:2806_t:CDS:2 [Ambispora gerdemannii]